jgi:hypothetical protein
MTRHQARHSRAPLQLASLIIRDRPEPAPRPDQTHGADGGGPADRPDRPVTARLARLARLASRQAIPPPSPPVLAFRLQTSLGFSIANKHRPGQASNGRTSPSAALHTFA